jgi:hypothetical protein
MEKTFEERLAEAAARREAARVEAQVAYAVGFVMTKLGVSDLQFASEEVEAFSKKYQVVANVDKSVHPETMVFKVRELPQ